MIKLKIDELAELLGKKRLEVEEMLRKSDIIELDLSRKNTKHYGVDEEDEGNLRIFE